MCDRLLHFLSVFYYGIMYSELSNQTQAKATDIPSAMPRRLCTCFVSRYCKILLISVTLVYVENVSN